MMMKCTSARKETYMDLKGFLFEMTGNILCMDSRDSWVYVMKSVVEIPIKSNGMKETRQINEEPGLRYETNERGEMIVWIVSSEG